MASGSYERKEFTGGAPVAETSGAIDGSALVLVISDATGWPTADTEPFVIAVDVATVNEEKMLVTARTGTTLTIGTRGYDNTTGLSHSSGATVAHVLDASTIDQANRLANLMTAKGDVIASNGINPIRVAGTAQLNATQDGFALQVKNAQPAGVEWGRPIALALAPSAPGAALVPRLWYSTTHHMLFSSDGTTWLPSAPFPKVDNNTERDLLFGGTPIQAGVAVMVGTQLQVWNGTGWRPVPKIEEAIVRFANAAARNAYFTSPATGDMAYLNDVHQLTTYRVNEWIVINQKITVSESAPAAPRDGDVWIQPTPEAV